MRCIHVRKYRGRARPCTHPATVAYTVDGEPYAYCHQHDTHERRHYAERYAIPRTLVTA